ncbi:MAG: pyridoxal phosphate-dependent aminotransferase [Chloracidobacterium sp.]|uniref:Pyridoxal phosphate-dependent aminotransferase n=1 Tax=Chloracidobacterium validum TaxID=2821543 RepID=A0ABX8BB17_9BACT|nr:pyridoxal phosphate-dependent aminotransferase [Chloracidobacterium validum]QUW03602.1 pyridoxal phosphate-dependent aminotransferase [Chloracidobacterium validum]
MPGFLSDVDLTPNRIERARRQAGAYIDLTSSNPTTQGLLFPPDILRAAADGYWSNRAYAPDPRGLLAARTAVVADYARRTPQFDVSPNQIFITASTSEAYSLLFTLLTEPGDNVLGPDVTYPLFEHLAAAHHIALRTYTLDEARGWAIQADSLLAAADERTRAILLISPHNPTGSIVAERLPTLTQLGLPLICDEVFAAFTYRAATTPPLGVLHPELPVFHLNGISKRFALPDLKLGWMALNEPAVARFGARLEILNDAFLSANSLTQFMLPRLFDQGTAFVATMQARIRAALDMALETLQRCSNVTVRPPDGGYYLFPQVAGWDDEEELVLDLLEAGVLVHPGYFYGCEQGAHLMISCLTEPTQLRAGLEILVNRLSSPA